jgi:hypothetical protein
MVSLDRLNPRRKNYMGTVNTECNAVGLVHLKQPQRKLTALKKQYYDLESKALDQIIRHISQVGSARKLSSLLYGNEDTLSSQISRAKSASPYKLASLLKILEDIDKKVSK